MAGARKHQGTGRIPYWAHQLVELLLGILLMVQGARIGEHSAVLLGLGVALVLMVLCSDGVLGAWPWIGRRLHRVLDVVTAAVLALTPLLLSLDGAFAIVILEVAALALLWLALRTDWRRPRSPRHSTEAPAPPPTPAAPSGGAPLARTLGAAVGRARNDGPRQLGRLVGRARKAAKAAIQPSEEPREPPTP